MLDYKILDSKQIVKRNDEEFIDLLGEVLDKSATVQGYPLIINKYYVGRPDLVSLALYGDDKYGDIICKLNGISNPFEMNEDDIIFVPSISYITNAVHKASDDSDFIDDDASTYLEITSSKNYQKRKNERRSPNQQLVGESNYIIDKSNGIVFY